VGPGFDVRRRGGGPDGIPRIQRLGFGDRTARNGTIEGKVKVNLPFYASGKGQLGEGRARRRGSALRGSRSLSKISEGKVDETMSQDPEHWDCPASSSRRKKAVLTVSQVGGRGGSEGGEP